MTVSMRGLELKSGSNAMRAAIEPPSSLRFPITSLTVICIASVIGTVLRQQEPAGNSVKQLGLFSVKALDSVSLYSVCSAWWLLLMLAFWVTSTSFCIARNTLKILVDLRIYKEYIRARSLTASGHRAQADLDEATAMAAMRIGQMLVGGRCQDGLCHQVWLHRGAQCHRSCGSGRRQIPSRLPSFEVLDDVMYKSITVVSAFLTIATVLGALWDVDTWSVVAGVAVTTFAFIGVNMFLSGLHSKGTLQHAHVAERLHISVRTHAVPRLLIKGGQHHAYQDQQGWFFPSSLQ